MHSERHCYSAYYQQKALQVGVVWDYVLCIYEFNTKLNDLRYPRGGYWGHIGKLTLLASKVFT